MDHRKKFKDFILIKLFLIQILITIRDIKSFQRKWVRNKQKSTEKINKYVIQSVFKIIENIFLKSSPILK